MICFLGESHAAQHLAAAAEKRGNKLCLKPENADVVFVSQDTPTDSGGNRELEGIKQLLKDASTTSAQIVLTSQVPPGFTRAQGLNNIYHQAETLRIKDAEERAYSPEYIAVGGPQGISRHYAEYLLSFHCPVLRMTWEEAEMSKIAVNMMLAAQVDCTNRLASAAHNAGAKWENVARALKLDSRIGPASYLKPGRWQDSKHLYRDYVTLEALSTS